MSSVDCSVNVSVFYCLLILLYDAIIQNCFANSKILSVLFYEENRILCVAKVANIPYELYAVHCYFAPKNVKLLCC